VFVLATDARLPVVPISIAGSRHVMKKGRLMVCPGVVRLTVHQPLGTDDVTRDQVRGFADRVREVVRRDVDEPSGGKAAAS